MQHTGQRPVTPSHYPISLSDYKHTPLIEICKAIFPSANGVHQTISDLDHLTSGRVLIM